MHSNIYNTGYVTIYKAMFGYKAQFLVLNTEDYPDEPFWEPWETSYYQYPEPDDKRLIKDAIKLAKEHDVPFIPFTEIIDWENGEYSRNHNHDLEV